MELFCYVHSFGDGVLLPFMLECMNLLYMPYSIACTWGYDYINIIFSLPLQKNK
jgi:hypothetical protein